MVWYKVSANHFDVVHTDNCYFCMAYKLTYIFFCLFEFFYFFLKYQSISQKRQCVMLPLNMVAKQWHFVSITHSIGRAFSAGSQLRCYLDGNLVSSEKCRYNMTFSFSKNVAIALGIKYQAYMLTHENLICHLS